MIIVDLNQVMIANLMILINRKENASKKYYLINDENFLRHMVLNSLRAINVNYRNKQWGDEMVIATDAKRSWRKEYFPFYKSHRKKFRAESDLDWVMIFGSIQKFTDEIKEFLPYPVILVDNVEADDIIGSLIMHEYTKAYAHQDFERYLIVSGDKDFVQLQRYGFVDQWDPPRKRWLKSDDPETFLIEHIINGDRGDGIPNMASRDDVFVTEGARQSKITKKRMEEWSRIIRNEETFTEEYLNRNFIRNKTLIDLSLTPQKYVDETLNKYNEDVGKNKSKMFEYFVDKKLVNMIERIGEF